MELVKPDADRALDGIGEEQRLFGFEADFAKDLRCIPMVVRFKLDRCGVKLSLKQWSKMGATNRAALLARRCDGAAEIRAYTATLVRLATTYCPEIIRWLPIEPRPPWADIACVPLDIVRQAASIGLAPPSLDCWRQLSNLERFALLKLARSDHDNHNFAPALREMRIALAPLR